MVNISAIAADNRLYVLLAAGGGAVIWNLIAWYLGLPTSSSHALIGAYGGGAVAAYISANGFAGASSVLIISGWIKTLAFIVLSPLIGMSIGFVLMVSVYWIFRRQVGKMIRDFASGQLFSAAAFRSTGGNDAQKKMDNYGVLVAGGLCNRCNVNFRHSAVVVCGAKRQ